MVWTTFEKNNEISDMQEIQIPLYLEEIIIL